LSATHLVFIIQLTVTRPDCTGLPEAREIRICFTGPDSYRNVNLDLSQGAFTARYKPQFRFTHV
jgi:hypothetical protein